MKKIHRSATDRVFAGVLGGLAAAFNWNVTATRVLFVILALTPFPAVIAYLILWMVVGDPA
ncbi:MAG: PspC domain-containing protein [Lactiplantibacillus plantarum]|nr:PspC domain-containing protein [Lactiplantibacillus plantarum]